MERLAPAFAAVLGLVATVLFPAGPALGSKQIWSLLKAGQGEGRFAVAGRLSVP